MFRSTTKQRSCIGNDVPISLDENVCMHLYFINHNSDNMNMAICLIHRDIGTLLIDWPKLLPLFVLAGLNPVPAMTIPDRRSGNDSK